MIEELEALEKASQLEREYLHKLKSCKEYKDFFKICRGKEEVRQETIDDYQKWKNSVFLEERKAMEDAFDICDKLDEER